MSWLIPFWRKDREDMGLLEFALTVLFYMFLMSPILTFLWFYLYNYSMQVIIIYTLVHLAISFALLLVLVAREFMSFITSIRRELYYLSFKDRINKKDIYDILDEYSEGWRDRGK